MRIIFTLLILLSTVAHGGDFSAQEGWQSLDSSQSYDNLLKSVKQATEDSRLSVVSEAGPTIAAGKRSIEIPGNCGIGIFNNDLAVQILALS